MTPCKKPLLMARKTIHNIMHSVASVFVPACRISIAAYVQGCESNWYAFRKYRSTCYSVCIFCDVVKQLRMYSFPCMGSFPSCLKERKGKKTIKESLAVTILWDCCRSATKGDGRLYAVANSSRGGLEASQHLSRDSFPEATGCLLPGRESLSRLSLASLAVSMTYCFSLSLLFLLNKVFTI